MTARRLPLAAALALLPGCNAAEVAVALTSDVAIAAMAVVGAVGMTGTVWATAREARRHWARLAEQAVAAERDAAFHTTEALEWRAHVAARPREAMLVLFAMQDEQRAELRASHAASLPLGIPARWRAAYLERARAKAVRS